MEKKEQKMAEIERMLTEEIQPNLEKLRKERSAFFEWQKNGMEIEHLTRLVHAFKYMEAEVSLGRSLHRGHLLGRGFPCLHYN